MHALLDVLTLHRMRVIAKPFYSLDPANIFIFIDGLRCNINTVNGPLTLLTEILTLQMEQ